MRQNNEFRKRPDPRWNFVYDTGTSQNMGAKMDILIYGVRTTGYSFKKDKF